MEPQEPDLDPVTLEAELAALREQRDDARELLTQAQALQREAGDRLERLRRVLG